MSWDSNPSWSILKYCVDHIRESTARTSQIDVFKRSLCLPPLTLASFLMESQWSFLAPWWRVLQESELLASSSRDSFREELRGLSVTVDPRTDFNYAPHRKPTLQEKIALFIRLRDAIELAFLLAIVDRREFNAVVTANVDTYADGERQADTASMLKFHEHEMPRHVELRFDEYWLNYPVVIGFAEAALSVFITPKRLEDRDPAFQDARLRILAQVPASETAMRRACEDLKISVSLTHCHAAAPLRLRQFLEEVAQQTQPKYPFIAAGFDLHAKQRVFTTSTSPQIESWLKTSCPYDYVSFSYEPQHPAAHFGQVLAAVLQPRSSEEQTGHTVRVNVPDIPDCDRFAQVFSALMHTQRVTSLQISLPQKCTKPRDRRLYLRWFVYALFSQWATHSIKHVTVGMNALSDEEVKDLRELLDCENPLPLLFDDDGSVDLQPKQVLVRANARVQLVLSTTPRLGIEQEFIVLPEEMWLDLTSEDSQSDGGWLVLVPAFGRCCVRQADTIQERISKKTTRESSGVTSLRVYEATLRVGQGRDIATFLCSFGQSLEALSVDLDSWHLNSEAFSNVLARCVSLKLLTLSISDTSVVPQIVKAYETGACNATHLRLRSTSTVAGSVDMVHFYEALADPNHRISQTVRELLVSYPNIPARISADEVTAMRAMLVNNSTLQFFERTCKPADNEAFDGLCDEHNAAMHTSTKPLAARSKYAFLSATSSKGSSIPVMQQLDNLVLSRVFEMAAELVVHRAVIGSYRCGSSG